MKQELLDWFNNYFDNCYSVIFDDDPNKIFMYYDKNFVRQQKIAKIDGKIIKKNDITGVCLFEQNWENNTLNCCYNYIWCHITEYDICTFNEIQAILKYLLQNRPIINTLTPVFLFDFQKPNPDNYHKMSIYL